ncbi:MAG: hypothetical protein GY820_48270 [Gammaproteobacteria bacterium]|nr:hypothetical protein [Gammaproteobacteria bacterium]
MSDLKMRAKFNGYFPQTGDGLPAFSGSAYQRGYGLGGVFKGLMRFVMPMVKQAGKAVGKQVLRTAGEIAQDVVNDVSVKESLERRGKRGVGRLLKKGNRAVKKSMVGSGLGKRPRVMRKRQMKRMRDIFDNNE